MAGSITISNTFNAQAGPIPLSQLDTNFAQSTSALNTLSTFSNYYVDTGSVNALVITVNSPQAVSYVPGLTVDVKVAVTNTGAATINVNGLGAKTITTTALTALTAGAMAAGAIVTLKYDGTQFQLQAGQGLTTINGFNVGYLESPINGQATPYTCVLTDSGKTLYYSATGAATFTIPSNASVPYPTGTILTFINDATGATNMTIAITSDTMVFSPSGGTGSRTLSQYGRAVAQKVAATRWLISGTGLT